MKKSPRRCISMKEISYKRFGYHVVYDADLYDAVDFANKHGFGYIVPDLMIPRFFPEKFSKSERKRIKKFASAKGVSLSFHGPSDHLNIGAIYPEIRRSILDRMKSCIDFAIDVGAERFTIHTAPPYDFVLAGKEGTYLRDHWSLYKTALKESLVELVRHSAGKVLICVENDSLSQMAMEVLEELLPTENLFLTWDIPKSHNNKGKPIAKIEKFFMHHLEKVIECHLHDQKLGNPSHDAVGVGNINFTRYLKILIPKNVHFTLEIRPRETAFESLQATYKILEKLGWRISR